MGNIFEQLEAILIENKKIKAKEKLRIGASERCCQSAYEGLDETLSLLDIDMHPHDFAELVIMCECS